MKLGIIRQGEDIERLLWMQLPANVKWIALAHRAAGQELPAAKIAKLVALVNETRSAP